MDGINFSYFLGNSLFLCQNIYKALPLRFCNTLSLYLAFCRIGKCGGMKFKLTQVNLDKILHVQYSGISELSCMKQLKNYKSSLLLLYCILN